MNNFPLISICVPVYNTARYIEKCVRSLFAQTYPNLEFVFVDDASSDDSMHIVQTIALEYPDIKDRICTIVPTKALPTHVGKQYLKQKENMCFV